MFKKVSEKMTLDNHAKYLMTKQSSQNLEEKNVSSGIARTKVLRFEWACCVEGNSLRTGNHKFT